MALHWSGEIRWLTDEEFDAEVTDPVERAFWQMFTSWRPAPRDAQQPSRPTNAEEATHA